MLLLEILDTQVGIRDWDLIVVAAGTRASVSLDWLVFFEELAQERDPQEPVVYLVVRLIRVHKAPWLTRAAEGGQSGSSCADIAPWTSDSISAFDCFRGHVR